MTQLRTVPSGDTTPPEAIQVSLELQIWLLRAAIVVAVAGIVLAWRRDRRRQAAVARIAASEAHWARRDLDRTELRPVGRGRPVLRTGAVLPRPAARR